MRQPPPTSRAARGFSLIELLVVISIISIVIAVSFPVLGNMISANSVQVAYNSIGSGVAGARTYATRTLPFYSNLGGGSSSADDGDGYSGAAMIVTSSHELRLVQNDEKALDRPITSGGVYLELDYKNGFADIEEIDQIALPGSIAILGLTRSNIAAYGNGNLCLLPPPFAVVFNNKGSLVTSFRDPTLPGTRGRSDGWVYYDADKDDYYDIASSDRFAPSATYADFLRGGSEAFNRNGFSFLPWEAIEPVAGILIFDPDKIPASLGYDPTIPDPITGTSAFDILEWATTAGNPARVIFFNRYTGIDIAR